MSNATRNHSVANFVLAAIILTIPVISRAQGLFAQAANSATKVRDAYAEIYNGFYGVGHRKTLYRAALDKRPDGTPNISVDAEAHTAAVTIRLSVNDAAYNAWKADARQRLDGLVRSIPNVDYNYETDHQPGDVPIGDRHYFFNNNELSVIQKWERDNAPKKAEIVVRVLFLDKDGNERWRYDIPLGRFFLSVGGAMDGTPWEPLDWLIRKKDHGFKEDSIAVIRFSKMSDSFMESISDVKCVVIDDETLIPERLATRKEIVPQIIQGMVLIPDQTFRLGKYEVTQAQWEAIMGTNPVGEKDESTGGNRPVFYVSWNDCQDFLKVLNSLPEIQDSGLVFRLPSRQEWELSARDYQSGWDVDHRGPEPVGTGFPPNKCGLYDIHGNVAEWTSTSSGGKRIACGESVGSTASWQELAPDKSMSFVGVRLCADDSKVESERKVQAEMRAREEAMRAREEAERKAREATELAKRLDEMRKTIVPALLDSMVVLPGKDFRVGRCEVTQKQWKAIMGNNPAHHKGDDNPVEMVSWDDCQQFLVKLNALPAVKESGLVFRLPTEDEWEYACRAGAEGHYCKLENGDEISDSYYGAFSLDRVAWSYHNAYFETHPVGQLESNAFGLFDMLGNVSEWTQSGNEKPGFFVVRGGNCMGNNQSCNAYRRNTCISNECHELIGFRLCADESDTLRSSREKDAAEQMEQKNAEPIAGEKTAAEQKAVEQAVSKACEEKLQQKRTEIAARTQGVKLPGGVRLEMVKTPDGLWFGKTEVTRAQWNAVMNAPSSSSSGGTKSRSGLQAPLLAKFAERGISDEQIAALMSANEETAEAFGQLRALFAQMESAGTASLFLDSDEFETLLHNTEVMFGAGSWNDADDGDDDDPGDASSSGSETSDFPVVNVSIVDCARFIKTLNALPATKAAGLRFRLPVLSEWRKASLAGGKPPFGLTFMGDDATIRDVGWIHNDEAPGLHPVAQRQPNAWGLYDMFGNVREFVGPVPKEDDAYIRAYGGSFRTWEENLRQWDDFNDPFWYKSKADDLGLRLCAEESE